MRERLSDLQKWILRRCIKNSIVRRDELKEFFGKNFGETFHFWDVIYDHKNEGAMFFEQQGLDINDYEFFIEQNRAGQKFNAYRPKLEKRSTRAIEATISRSLKKLKTKGLVAETAAPRSGRYYLTDSGFIKVNKFATTENLLTYKDYCNRMDEQEREQTARYKSFEKSILGIIPVNQ